MPVPNSGPRAATGNLLLGCDLIKFGDWKDDDHDVLSGRIFKAATSLEATPWKWMLTAGPIAGALVRADSLLLLPHVLSTSAREEIIGC